MDQTSMGAKCACPHHKMFGIWLIILGALFLANALGVLSADTLAIAWPIVVILAGAQKLVEHKCKCCSRM